MIGGFILWNRRQQYWHVVQKKLAPTTVDVIIEQIYSPKIHEELKAYIAQQTDAEHLVVFSPQSFTKNIKKQFPIISKVFLNRDSPEKLTMHIVGVKPCLRFTDGYVLANKPELFVQGVFAQYPLNKIPEVELFMTGTEHRISAELYAFFAKVPHAYWNKYHISYKAPGDIILKPRDKQLAYECHVDQASFFEAKKLEQVEALFAQQKVLQGIKKGKTRFIFDLRFADRIFVSQQKGGGGNEYRHAV